jgi:carbamoyl-phosphate synthase small subunit
VVAIDYGAKDNIFRNLVKAGASVTVVPAETSLEDILALKPAGVFLSNGPGDPAATGEYAVPVIKALLDRDVPLFGICLGHQMLGWPPAPRPSRCIRATAAPTIRSSAPPRAWSRSPR